jgi:hypothetical protein
VGTGTSCPVIFSGNESWITTTILNLADNYYGIPAWVGYYAYPNTSPHERSATLTVGTTKVTLTQAGVPQVATPTFSPSSGTYTGATTITIGETTKGATLYYTTDGTTPTTASTEYAPAGIAVSKTETIKAIADAMGYISSPVATATFTIK